MCVNFTKKTITLKYTVHVHHRFFFVFTVHYIRVRALTDMCRPDQPKPAPVELRVGVSAPPGTDVVFQHPAQQTFNSAPGQQGLPGREYNER